MAVSKDNTEGIEMEKTISIVGNNAILRWTTSWVLMQVYQQPFHTSLFVPVHLYANMLA